MPLTSVYGGCPRDGEAKTLVFSTTDVESLFGIKCNALSDLLKMTAELSQDITRRVLLKHQA